MAGMYGMLVYIHVFLYAILKAFICRQDSVYAVCHSGHPLHPDLPVGPRAAAPQPHLRPPLHTDRQTPGHGQLPGGASTLVILHSLKHTS